MDHEPKLLLIDRINEQGMIVSYLGRKQKVPGWRHFDTSRSSLAVLEEESGV